MNVLAGPIEGRHDEGMFASIGSDGRRFVVWGLGETAEAAEVEARAQGRDAGCDPELCATVEVDAAREALIRAGDVTADDLI